MYWRGQYSPVNNEPQLRRFTFLKALALSFVGDIFHWGGTVFTSEYCPGGQYSPVNNVRGDIIHGGTFFTPTSARRIRVRVA